MASKVENNNDDDSFIILSTSPSSSLEMRYNGVENDEMSDKEQLEDAMKELPLEASMAFKAHFQIGDNPSPASMMVASTIVTDDSSIEALQKRFGELLDENIILKETLKQNNDSMKEQLQLISSCQDDMLKTHKIHREKFDETRDLVERLRKENKILKQETVRLSETLSQPGSDRSGVRSGPSSGVEFVTSPEDDTINKLTSQLELVEKQRRQVIVENEKLTWQKESVEHIIDATTKERDEIKEKLKKLELQISNADSEHAHEVKKLHFIIQDLQSQLKSATNNKATTDELTARDQVIQQLEGKITKLQNEYKMAQIKILELENIKLEFAQHKSGLSETVRMYKEQIQDLSTRLKDAQTTMFQPVRLSISSESETSSSSEFSSYISNVKLYDRALKHLAEFVNALTSGLTDSLVQTIGTVASLYDYKLERGSIENFKTGLAEVKQQLERQHSNALNNVSKLRGMLSIFEDIFKDHNELLKKVLTKPDKQSGNGGVEALTSALVARGHELQQLQNELQDHRTRRDDADLLRAQLLQYQSDFEVEREAREKMASEKDDILTDLRTTEKRLKELTQQMEDVRKLNPGVFRTVTNKNPLQQSSRSSTETSGSSRTTATTTTTTGNMVYTCPKCMRFSSDQYKVMEDHFDLCLDDF